MRMQSESSIRRVPMETEDVTFVSDDPVRYPDRVITVEQEEFTPYFEVITPNSGGGRTEWKSFEHFKTVQASTAKVGKTTLSCEAMGYYPHHSSGDTSLPFAGYDHYSWGASTGGPYGDAGSFDMNLPALYVPRSDGGFVPPPADLDILCTRALKSMLPYIREELSLVNSLVELRDFKRPVNNLVKTLRNPRLLAELPKKLTRNYNPKGWSLARLVRSAAEANLSYQFAIRPLIADIRAVCSALSRTERRINDFLVRQGRPMNRHWVCSLEEMQSSNEETSTDGSWTWIDQFTKGTYLRAARQVICDPTEFHAQVQYNFRYTELQAAQAQLFALLDSLGVNLNPAIIWNAIPWTFLVDWVIDVSSYLETLKRQNMEPVLNIRRFLWSVRRRRRIFVTKVIRIQYYERVLSVQRTTLPVVTQTAYRRCVDMPAMSMLEACGLSMNKLSLGVSLAVVRRRRPRTRRL